MYKFLHLYLLNSSSLTPAHIMFQYICAPMVLFLCSFSPTTLSSPSLHSPFPCPSHLPVSLCSALSFYASCSFFSLSVSLPLQSYISSLSVGFLTSDSFLFQPTLPTSSSSDAFIPVMSFTFQGQMLTTRKPNPTKSATVTVVAAREMRMILLGVRGPGGFAAVTESVPSS